MLDFNLVFELKEGTGKTSEIGPVGGKVESVHHRAFNDVHPAAETLVEEADYRFIG